MVRDLDLAEPNVADARRLEVVADGLPLFGAAQLAIDTTIVSTLHANGEARRVMRMGSRKERTHPKLVGRPRRARLVVLGVEVGGRWSKEKQSFLSSAARASARSERPLVQKRMDRRDDSSGVLVVLHGGASRGDVSARAPKCVRATRRPTTWNGISDTQVWIRD